MLCGSTSPTLETDMQLDTKLSIPPQVMSRLVGDETVLLDLSSGIYFGLDGVGKRIWESVADGLSLGETAAARRGWQADLGVGCRWLEPR